jgi:hypothetical protein
VTPDWLIVTGQQGAEVTLAVDLRAFFRSPEGRRAVRDAAAEYGLDPDGPATAERLAELVERMIEADGEGV